MYNIAYVFADVSHHFIYLIESLFPVIRKLRVTPLREGVKTTVDGSKIKFAKGDKAIKIQNDKGGYHKRPYERYLTTLISIPIT